MSANQPNLSLTELVMVVSQYCRTCQFVIFLGLGELVWLLLQEEKKAWDVFQMLV